MPFFLFHSNGCRQGNAVKTQFSSFGRKRWKVLGWISCCVTISSLLGFFWVCLLQFCGFFFALNLFWSSSFGILHCKLLFCRYWSTGIVGIQKKKLNHQGSGVGESPGELTSGILDVIIELSMGWRDTTRSRLIQYDEIQRWYQGFLFWNLPTNDIWSSLHQPALLGTLQSGWPSDLELVVRQKEAQEPHGKPSGAMFSISTGKLTLKTSCFRTGLKTVILDFCCVLNLKNNLLRDFSPRLWKTSTCKDFSPHKMWIRSTFVHTRYLHNLYPIPLYWFVSIDIVGRMVESLVCGSHFPPPWYSQPAPWSPYSSCAEAKRFAQQQPPLETAHQTSKLPWKSWFETLRHMKDF